VTATVTARLCAVVTLPTAGVTVTVGVAKGNVTVTAAVPDALLNVAELFASGVYFAVSVSLPAVSDPDGIVMVADPATSVVEDDV
jgi:type IV secretory pathway protease TraF